MARKSPFKHHRFPREILCAVRWYLRYPLSYQDVVDLLADRDATVDRSKLYRWVQKFGPELTRRTEKHLRRASVDWHAPFVATTPPERRLLARGMIGAPLTIGPAGTCGLPERRTNVEVSA